MKVILLVVGVLLVLGLALLVARAMGSPLAKQKQP